MPHNSENRQTLIAVVAPELGTQKEASNILHVHQTTVFRSLKRFPASSKLHEEKYPRDVKRHYFHASLCFVFISNLSDHMWQRFKKEKMRLILLMKPSPWIADMFVVYLKPSLIFTQTNTSMIIAKVFQYIL